MNIAPLYMMYDGQQEPIPSPPQAFYAWWWEHREGGPEPSAHCPQCNTRIWTADGRSYVCRCGYVTLTVGIRDEIERNRIAVRDREGS